MKPLLKEYRKSMSADVLHDWADDMIALVGNMEKKLRTANAAKALANRRADDLQRELETVRHQYQRPLNLVVGKCGVGTCLREASNDAAAEELMEASVAFVTNLLEGEFISTDRENRFNRAVKSYKERMKP